MNKSSLVNDREYHYVSPKEFAESINGSNINMFQNELTEVGKGMKYKMEKQIIDNDFCNICFKRDSLVVSENSLYEKNHVNEQSKQDKSKNRPQDDCHQNTPNNKRMSNKSNTNDNILLKEVEGSNKVDQIYKAHSQLKKPLTDKSDQKLDDNSFYQTQNKQEQEIVIRAKNTSDQISQNSPLLKKQLSKKMNYQVSNHTGLNESSNRYQIPFTFQGPDSSINQKGNYENADGQDKQNYEQVQSKKKVPTFQQITL